MFAEALKKFMIREYEETERLFQSLDLITSELVALLLEFSETQINRIPFRGSWTAAQVAEHITRSNIGIERSLRAEGKPTSRDPLENVPKLEEQFLNFDVKLHSPKFILPTRDIYQKEIVVADLRRSIEKLRQTRDVVSLTETLSHPIFGEITRLELLHFVLYHTQRHLRQLREIFRVTLAHELNARPRKVVSFVHASLDGFVAGPNGEMDWITMDDEIFEDAIALATAADTALYGRTTYQMMESYWPSVLKSPEATKNELQHAQWVEDVHKVVFSTSLEKAHWNNTKLIKTNIQAEVAALKQQPGRNMMIFGSPGLTHSLMQMGLIDEYRINVNPIVLGDGVPLFEKIDDRINLRLLNTKRFESGVIGLHYETTNDNRK